MLIDTVDMEIEQSLNTHRSHKSWLADLREALSDKLEEVVAVADDGDDDVRPFLFKLVQWLKNFHINVAAASNHKKPPLPEPMG